MMKSALFMGAVYSIMGGVTSMPMAPPSVDPRWKGLVVRIDRVNRAANNGWWSLDSDPKCTNADNKCWAACSQSYDVYLSSTGNTYTMLKSVRGTDASANGCDQYFCSKNLDASGSITSGSVIQSSGLTVDLADSSNMKTIFTHTDAPSSPQYSCKETHQVTKISYHHGSEDGTYTPSPFCYADATKTSIVSTCGAGSSCCAGVCTAGDRTKCAKKYEDPLDAMKNGGPTSRAGVVAMVVNNMWMVVGILSVLIFIVTIALVIRVRSLRKAEQIVAVDSPRKAKSFRDGSGASYL